VSVIDGLKWTSSIVRSGVLAALNAEHARARSSMAMALVCGFFAGCGGGLVHSTLSLSSKQWHFQCPAGLATSLPAFAVRTSALLAALYYGLVNPHHYLPYTPLLSRDDALVVVFLVITFQDALTNPSSWRRFKSMGAKDNVNHSSNSSSSSSSSDTKVNTNKSKAKQLAKQKVKRH
jgi:hypothetical protein